MAVPQLVTEYIRLSATVATAHPLRLRPFEPAGQRPFSHLENNKAAVPFTCLVDAVGCHFVTFGCPNLIGLFLFHNLRYFAHTEVELFGLSVFSAVQIYPIAMVQFRRDNDHALGIFVAEPAKLIIKV